MLSTNFALSEVWVQLSPILRVRRRPQMRKHDVCSSGQYLHRRYPWQGAIIAAEPKSARFTRRMQRHASNERRLPSLGPLRSWAFCLIDTINQSGCTYTFLHHFAMQLDVSYQGHKVCEPDKYVSSHNGLSFAELHTCLPQSCVIDPSSHAVNFNKSVMQALLALLHRSSN